MTRLEARQAAAGGRVAAWGAVHRWSSLVCTGFLLLICLTGLPLIFHDEIDHWLRPTTYAPAAPGAPRISLDRLVARSRSLYPGEAVATIFADDDEPQVYVWMAPSLAVANADRRAMHFLRFDAHDGRLLERSRALHREGRSFTDWMVEVHSELVAGLPGALFLGAMAALFVVAIVSGVVLYGPFTRKLAFGTVRLDRTRRIRWLDLHNLLGITTLAWATVIGLTGLMNELETPLFALWQRTQVQPLLAEQAGRPSVIEVPPVSPQRATDAALRAEPGRIVTSLGYPGFDDSPRTDYLLWAKGATPLTAQLMTPILVDARSGGLTAMPTMPWYLRLLEICRPLHFGDYGGMPLKVIWTLLDLVTIGVLASGIYLWIARPRRERLPAGSTARHSSILSVEAAE